jgi:predicted amidohydrolase YtcJ
VKFRGEVLTEVALQLVLRLLVTLNLFQGPSCRKPGASRIGTCREVGVAEPRSGNLAKWTLKQVQGDGLGWVMICLALLPTAAKADTLIDNVDGITIDAGGEVQRFTGLLTDNNGRIQQIFLRGEKRPLKVDFKMDGKGRVLMPGIIDSHVQLMKLGLSRIAPAAPGAKPRPEDRDVAFYELQKLLIERGITAVADMGTTIEDWQTYRRAGDLGALTLRIIAYAEGTEAMTLIGGPGPTPWLYDDRLRLNGVHLTLDGSLEARTAALKTPYADMPKLRGDLKLNEIQLKNLLSRASIDRFQVAVDAVGDRASAALLTAIEDVAQTYKGDRRWRVEQAQVVDPQDAARFGKSGMAVSVQPMAPGTSVAAARLGPLRMAGAFAWQPLRAGGARVVLGSGAANELPDPFATLALAKAQMPAEAALAGQTSNAAWAAFAEGRIGRIAVGQRADFVLIDRDPLLASPAELRNTRVLQTWVGGRLVYQAK